MAVAPPSGFDDQVNEVREVAQVSEPRPQIRVVTIAPVLVTTPRVVGIVVAASGTAVTDVRQTKPTEPQAMLADVTGAPSLTCR